MKVCLMSITCLASEVLLVESFLFVSNVCTIQVASWSILDTCYCCIVWYNHSLHLLLPSFLFESSFIQTVVYENIKQTATRYIIKLQKNAGCYLTIWKNWLVECLRPESPLHAHHEWVKFEWSSTVEVAVTIKQNSDSVYNIRIVFKQRSQTTK